MFLVMICTVIYINSTKHYKSLKIENIINIAVQNINRSAPLKKYNLMNFLFSLFCSICLG